MEYIERMESELIELHNRSVKLDAFLHKNTVELDDTQRFFMVAQLNYMWLYEDILTRRIAYERRLHK